MTGAVAFAMVLASTVVYMVFVSAMVWRDGLLSTRQKWAQLLMVWLLPVAGTAAVHLVHLVQAAPPPVRDPDFTHEANERGAA